MGRSHTGGSCPKSPTIIIDRPPKGMLEYSGNAATLVGASTILLCKAPNGLTSGSLKFLTGRQVFVSSRHFTGKFDKSHDSVTIRFLLPDEKHGWTFGIEIREGWGEGCQMNNMTGLLELRLPDEKYVRIFGIEMSFTKLGSGKQLKSALLYLVGLLYFVKRRTLVDQDEPYLHNKARTWNNAGLLETGLHNKGRRTPLDEPDLQCCWTFTLGVSFLERHFERVSVSMEHMEHHFERTGTVQSFTIMYLFSNDINKGAAINTC
ncbi:hypothetical protein RCL_jg7695.t3 [Rhizophagus clarus]|uniref:Uncharacterized protein n=1 Tax=Rhizophagus clarus TaxID=94130 RepID=A0A8H3MFB4_9GLOM|nr:hypothetical protein RCL_jg7695.t3 [Rhizophagus clarus]